MVNFHEKFDQGHGTVFIVVPNKVKLPIDALSKLWAKYKKIIEQKYAVDIMANFYSINQNTTKCLFFLNGAYAEKHTIDRRIYECRFKDTFQFWLNGFESVIDSIVFDIERAITLTEEKAAKITARVFKEYTFAVEKQLPICTKNELSEKLHSERRAYKKAKKAERVAKALAKKAAQQDLSHQD